MTHTSRNRLPTVSVIVPTYNRSSFLLEAVNSVLAQTHPVSEILVVDDASHAEHREIIEELGSRQRVRMLRRATKGGVSRARNFGLEHATGDFILFLDDDDILLPDAIAHMLHKFAHDDETDIVVCRSLCLFRPGSSEKLYQGPCHIDLRRSHRVIHKACSDKSIRHFLEFERDPTIAILRSCPSVDSCLIRRSALSGTWFADDMEFGEDWDFWLQLARKGCRFRCETKPLVLVRRHGDNASLRNHDRRQLLRHIAVATPSSREEGFLLSAIRALGQYGADSWLAMLRLAARPDLFVKYSSLAAIRKMRNFLFFGAPFSDMAVQVRNLDSILKSMDLSPFDITQHAFGQSPPPPLLQNQSVSKASMASSRTSQ